MSPDRVKLVLPLERGCQLADYDYTKHYELEVGGEILPIVFITKRDTLDFAREQNLGAVVLHKRTQSGAGDYSVPMTLIRESK